jgi:sigma-B regulation protein RsbU (phosphoserine phosphatase)
MASLAGREPADVARLGNWPPLCIITSHVQCIGYQASNSEGDQKGIMSSAQPSQPSVDRLALLCRLSQAFNSSLDLDTVLNRVMDEVIAAMHAERGFVMLRDPDGQMLFRAARGMDRETIDHPQFQVSRSVVERVAREGQPIHTSDAQSDDRFSMRQSVQTLGLRSILCVPLMTKDMVTGVVYVDNRLQAGIFTPDDLELLSAIASSAAIAIENARLYQVAVEKGRMEQELQMAHQVQASLLRCAMPQVPGWEFASRWRPAHEVAGDYYDLIMLDKGQLGLVIADVSGKGMAAALFMALTRSVVRACAGHNSSPADGIAHANQLICADSSGGMFVSLFYGLLDPRSGQLTYVNAGHNPPLLCRGEQDELTELGRTGIILGVLEEAAFEQRTIQLHPGDLLLLYTDGVTEATDGQGEEFGEQRLRRIVHQRRGAPVAEIVIAIEQAVGEFVGTAAASDDITIAAAKRLAKGATAKSRN